jgi:hypothetical protein
MFVCCHGLIRDFAVLGNALTLRLSSSTIIKNECATALELHAKLSKDWDGGKFVDDDDVLLIRCVFSILGAWKDTVLPGATFYLPMHVSAYGIYRFVLLLLSFCCFVLFNFWIFCFEKVR